MGAALIDTVIVSAIIFPILFAVYGKEYFMGGALVSGYLDTLLNYVFPTIAVLIFWNYKSATPGKIVLKMIIVDARTGRAPSKGQLIGRYFAYYLSLLPLGLGFLWIAWDKRKQGWHDKLAGTVVIRPEQHQETI
ncbi:MAG: RDD family protein [Candidatus Marinimicrobia bacterium]|nr:RDD family protein [Candidatus Neomarinimicrobiota bacterium]